MRIWTHLSIRLDALDADKLEALCAALGTNPSEAVRLLIRIADIDALVADYKPPDRRGRGYHRHTAERRRGIIAALAGRIVAGAQADLAAQQESGESV